MASRSLQAFESAPAPQSNSSDSLSPVGGSTKRKASLACSACRRRKSRCTDGSPCQACKAHGTECVKDESDDMRRRLAVKKRLNSADVDRKLLDSLFELLRIGYREQIDSLINLIRSNAPRQDLQAFLDDGHVVESPSSIGKVLSNEDSLLLPRRCPRRRHRTGSIADIMNPPIQVPAKPWTTVTDDDDLVSHLLSLWFVWAHQWWHWVDKVLFLEAMRTQDLNNPLCAPYLVNMILADACLLDSIEDDEDEPHPFLRDQFYAEATKGLEAEKGQVSLTIVQATGVQWTYLDMNGRDEVGLPVLSEQIFMSKELDKYQEQLSKDPKISPETLSKVDKSISRLEWALFSLNAFTLVGSRRAYTLDPPRRPHPHNGHDDDAESRTWMPYPRQAPQINFHEECHFACVTSLAREAHMNEVTFMKLNEESNGSTNETFGQRQKLENWAKSIPSCMQLHENAMPHVLTLHAMHHWIILIIAKQAAAAGAGISTRPTATFTPDSSSTSHWQQVSVSAAVTIGSLMDRLITKWGIEIFPVILIHPISLALFTLFENVEHGDRKKAFVSMCVILRAASRRFKVGKGLLKLVKRTAEDKGLTLPKEIEGLFRFERSRSESRGSEQSKDPPIDGIGMQYLLEKWDDLDLDEY